MKQIPENELTLLVKYRQELSAELHAIIQYWKNYVATKEHDFFGEVNDEDQPDPAAPKGIVLLSRVLWTFSRTARFLNDANSLSKADDAYQVIKTQFIDQQYGGVYWSVTPDGELLDGRKQIYGLAFCIYGLAAYTSVTGNTGALQLAIEIYNKIEEKSFDNLYGGYIEAFTREWNVASDVRLSDKDANENKTMNTHLHIVEAYAALYEIWPDAGLKKKIEGLLDIFNHYIITQDKKHLHLFFTDSWELKSTAQSYGHDIEAAWLLLECAEVIGEEKYIAMYKYIAGQLTDGVIPAMDNDGGLWYEYEPATNHWIREKHWWPQAEAMVGFYNMYELTGEKKYLDYSVNCYAFVQHYLKSNNTGEWHWGIDDKNTLIKKGKAGFWKCPYHNGRACMEIIKRINRYVPLSDTV